jgi:transposase
MALGKRRRDQQLEAFVVASDLPKSPGHPFYTAVNRPLADNGFDPLVEKLCTPVLRRNDGAAWRAVRPCMMSGRS